jgi:carboxylesterase type B
LDRGSRLEESERLPFQRAILLSNAIAVPAKPIPEAEDQFERFCREVGYSTSDSSGNDDDDALLGYLRSLPTEKVLDAVHRMGGGGIFRPVADGEWIPTDILEWEAGGGFARALARGGFVQAILGETSIEESVPLLKLLCRY